jgi:hypothetical protein
MSAPAELDVIVKKTEQVALFRVLKLITDSEKSGTTDTEIIKIIKQHINTLTE